MTKSNNEKSAKPSSNQAMMTEREAMDRINKLIQRQINQNSGAHPETEGARVDPGPLLPKIKELSKDYMDNSDKVAPEYKGEQPDDKIINPDVETLVQKLYQSREAMPMEAEIDEDEVPYEDRPGYLGQVYDNEVYLEVSMGHLAKFKWSDYLEAAEDESDRDLSINFNGVEQEIRANVWSAHEFIEAIPSVSTLNDGDVIAFYKEDGCTDIQILEDANALYEGLVSDLETLKSESP